MYQGTDRSTEPDQWRSRPLEQQMFERVDGQQLMVKRSQLGKPPRQIKNTSQKTDRGFGTRVYMLPLSRPIDSGP
jgi:hypothetical protein